MTRYLVHELVWQGALYFLWGATLGCGEDELVLVAHKQLFEDVQAGVPYLPALEVSPGDWIPGRLLTVVDGHLGRFQRLPPPSWRLAARCDRELVLALHFEDDEHPSTVRSPSLLV